MLGKDVLERPSEWGFRTNLMFETCRRERKLKTWSTFVNLDWHVSNIKFVQRGAPTRPSPTLRMIYLRAAIPKSVIFNYARKCSGRAHSPNLSGTEGVSKNEKLPFFENWEVARNRMKPCTCYSTFFENWKDMTSCQEASLSIKNRSSGSATQRRL